MKLVKVIALILAVVGAATLASLFINWVGDVFGLPGLYCVLAVELVILGAVFWGEFE